MHTAANKQKLRRAVKEFRAPNAKASEFVSDVIVIEGPACCIALRMRSAAGRFKSV